MATTRTRWNGKWLAALVLSAGLIGGSALAADAAGAPATASIVREATANGQAPADDEACGAEETEGPAATIDDGEELLPEATISLDAAIAAAQNAAAGAIGEVDLERFDGTLVFNVDVGSEDVKVDAATGDVIGAESEESEADEASTEDEADDCDAEGDEGSPGTLDDGKDLLPQATITLEAAVTTAQGAAEGAVGEVDLEMAGGTLVFNVDIGDQDVQVDAATGQIRSVEQDD